MKVKKIKSVLSLYKPIERVEIPMPSGNTVLRLFHPRVAIEHCTHWSMNARFAPSAPMSASEHHERIKKQAPKEYLNLRNSIRLMRGIVEPPLAIYDPTLNKFVIHGGNRRLFCAIEEGIKEIPLYLYVNYTPADLNALRDHVEVNPTKVPHNPLYIAKLVHDAVTGATTRESLEAVYKEVKSRWNLGRTEVDKKKRILDHIIQFRTTRSEAFDHDPQSYKAFETYDSLNQTTFERLRVNGQLDKLGWVHRIAESYLAKNIAHDDMAKGVSFLASLNDHDSLWEDIREGRMDIKSADTLREITAIARARGDGSKDISIEVRRVLAWAFDRMQASPSDSQCAAVLIEVDKGREKLAAVLATLKRMAESPSQVQDGVK